MCCGLLEEALSSLDQRKLCYLRGQDLNVGPPECPASSDGEWWCLVTPVHFNMGSEAHTRFNILTPIRQHWARGSVVGSGAMLQAGKSRVRFPLRSLDFSVDLILPASGN
jgi:hypothetical protein